MNPRINSTRVKIEKRHKVQSAYLQLISGLAVFKFPMQLHVQYNTKLCNKWVKWIWPTQTSLKARLEVNCIES
jgi:hypothetical protein